MQLGARDRRERHPRPRDGSETQVYGGHAFAPQTLMLFVLAVCGLLLWAWLKAGGAILVGALLLAALLIGYAATFTWMAQVLEHGGLWIGVDESSNSPSVMVIRRGPLGYLGVRSSDGRVRRVPGSLHRSGPVIKIRGRLVTDGAPRWQRLSWDPATESVTDLARRIKVGHPSDQTRDGHES